MSPAPFYLLLPMGCRVKIRDIIFKELLPRMPGIGTKVDSGFVSANFALEHSHETGAAFCGKGAAL